MKLNGLDIDTDALGAGFFELICKMGLDGVVAVGMRPKVVADKLEELLREKVASLGVDKAEVERTVRQIDRAVWSSIYEHASKEGKMLR